MRALKYGFTARDIFMGFDKKIMGKTFLRKYNSTRELASRVFIRCFHHIILDIINNNNIFVLPLPFGNYGEFSLYKYEDEDFIERYKRGKFSGLDFVRSQFSAHELRFYYNTKSGTRSKPIYVDKNLKQMIYNFSYRN